MRVIRVLLRLVPCALILATAAAAAYAASFDELVSRLSKNDKASDDAYEALLSAPDAGPAIISGLGSSNANIRRKCVRLAGERGSDTFVPAVAKLVHDGDLGVRREVADDAARLGPKARRILLEGIHDPDAEVRLSSGLGLVKLDGNTHAVEPLRKDPSPMVRATILRESARFGDESAREKALSIITSTAALVSRLEAIKALGYVSKPEDALLLRHLSDNAKEGFIQLYARDALRQTELRFAPDPVGYLRGLLTSQDSGARGWAARALVTRKDDASRELTKEIISDSKHPAYSEVLRASKLAK